MGNQSAECGKWEILTTNIALAYPLRRCAALTATFVISKHMDPAVNNTKATGILSIMFPEVSVKPAPPCRYTNSSCFFGASTHRTATRVARLNRFKWSNEFIPDSPVVSRGKQLVSIGANPSRSRRVCESSGNEPSSSAFASSASSRNTSTNRESAIASADLLAVLLY